MRSVTYNVVITKSPQVTDKLFFDKFGRKSFEERFSSLNAEEKRDLLLVAPQRNNNFISFEINFPTAQGGRYAVLKVLESDRILEYFAMSKTANEQLIKQRANIIKGFRGSNALFDAAAKLSPSFYISYGVGDDVSKWAGPYMVDMIDANLTMTQDNVRQLELMFQPLMTSQFVFTNKGFDDVLTAQKYSVFDGTFNADQEVEMISKVSFPVKNNKLKIGNLDGERRFNYAVRALIKKYLADRFQIPPGNVLCLFDDDFGFLDKPLIQKNLDIMNRSLGRCGMSMGYDINFGKLGGDITFELANVATGLVRLRQRFNQTGELLKSKRAVQKQLAENSDEIKDLENGILANAYPALLVSNTVKSDVASTLAGTSTFGATPEAVVANKYFIYEKGPLPSDRIPVNVSEQEVKRRQQQGVTLVTSNSNDFSGPEAIRIRQQAVTRIKNRRKVLNGTGASQKDDETPEERQARLGLRKTVKVQKAGTRPSTQDIRTLLSDSFSIVKSRVYNSNIDEMIETDYTQYNQVNLTMGTVFKAGDVSDTELAALKPIYKLVESVGILSEFKDKQIKDFDILEENNYKILKTLYKNGLIESDSKPVIIFGRDRIIQALLYPDNDQELLFKTLGGKGDLIFSEMAGTEADDYKTRKIFDVENEKDLKNQRGANLDEITSYRQSTVFVGYSNQKRKSIVFKSEPSVLEVLDAFKTYQKEFLGLVKDLKGPITSSFEEKVDFGNFYNQAVKVLDTLKAPLVFTSNTKNANVLDLSFDSSPYKGVLLNMGYESGYRLLDETSNVQEILFDSTVDNPSLNKLVRSIERTVIDRNTKELDISKLGSSDVRKTILSVVASEGEVGNASLKNILDFILFKYGTNSSFTRKTEPGNVGVQNANIYKNINRYVIGANVRTLPFFNTTIIPGRDCYLFGLSNQVLGNNQDLREIAAPAIFTNSYKIAGVKHKISFDQAFSEFDLLPGELGLGAATEDPSVVEFYKFTEEEIEQERASQVQEAKKASRTEARFQSYVRSSTSIPGK